LRQQQILAYEMNIQMSKTINLTKALKGQDVQGNWEN
jgi:hypothetical protein